MHNAAEMLREVGEFFSVVHLAAAHGERDFGLVERESVGPAVAPIDDIEAVIIAVRLAIQRQERGLVLHEFAHRILQNAMAEIHHHDHIVAIDLAGDALDQRTLQFFPGGAPVDEINRKQLGELLAFARGST
jgi:hypothetical protein